MRDALGKMDAGARARLANAPQDDTRACSPDNKAARFNDEVAAQKRKLKTQKALAGLQSGVDRLSGKRRPIAPPKCSAGER